MTFTRLKEMLANAGRVLGINQRNSLFVYPCNRLGDLPIADDKLRTKLIMAEAGVPMPVTYRVYRHFFELQRVEQDLSSYGDFVIKPSGGSGGSGVLVVTGRRGPRWTDVAGRSYAVGDLRKHILDIVFGAYSNDLQDAAIVEERIRQHPEVDRVCPLGLADVRVLTLREEPVMAMLRLPTRRSLGKANLHQGGVGVGVDLETGRATHAIFRGRSIDRHPDTRAALLDLALPDWDRVLEVGRMAAQAVPLKYVGADIALSTHGPVLIEVNARPGLEIQNANMKPLREVLERIAGGPK